MLRILLANIVFWVLACAPALAGYAASRAWFEGLGEDRYSIQRNLILAGFYTGFIDGEFDSGVYKALTDYEETRMVVPDGVLDPGDIQLLQTLADNNFERFGFSRWHDEAAGLDFYLPRALLNPSLSGDYGSEFSSDETSYALTTVFQPLATDTLQPVSDLMSMRFAGQPLSYSFISKQAAIVAGEVQLENGDMRTEYTFMLKVPGGAAGFVLWWGEQDRRTGPIVAAFMAASARALNSPDGPPPGPAPQDETGATAKLHRFGAFHVNPDNPALAVLSGWITPDTKADFRQMVTAFPDIRTIEFNSAGGDVNSALVVAYRIREYGYETLVPAGAECLSACAFMFLAGTRRTVDGELGVHQIRAEVDDNEMIQRDLSVVIEAMLSFGVDQRVISAMLRTGPDHMYVFTGAELRDWGIVGSAAAPSSRDQVSGPARFRERALLLQASEANETGAIPTEGVVDWVVPGSGPAAPLFSAEANFAPRTFEMSVSFSENTDAELPASHVFDVAFRIAPGFSGGAIANFGGILAKTEELVPGQPLIGVPARTPEDTFQLYLDGQMAARLANSRLLSDVKFLDFAIIYENGRQAIVTLAVNDAIREIFAAWSE